MKTEISVKKACNLGLLRRPREAHHKAKGVNATPSQIQAYLDNGGEITTGPACPIDPTRKTFRAYA